MPSLVSRTALIRPALLGAGAVAVATALLLTGCAPAAQSNDAAVSDRSPASDASASTSAEEKESEVGDPAQHTATLVMAGQSFTFSPTVCMLEDDAVLVYGPGIDDDSQDPAFLDIDLTSEGSFTHGEVRIELGTNQQFDSRDEFFVAFAGGVDDFELTYDDASLTFTGEFRFAGDGQLGPGTIQVGCN